MRRSALLMLLIGVAGCATPDLNLPSASMASRDAGAGEWQGTATGREMARALGVMSEPVRLALEEGDRYTLIHRQGTGEIRSTGSVTTSGSRLILDGHIVAPGMHTGLILAPRP